MFKVRENLRKEAGTVKQHGTMGVETIQKDTGELKIHRSRENYLIFGSMKKVLLVLVVLIGFGIDANAQPFTNFYSDNKITAIIRENSYNDCSQLNSLGDNYKRRKHLYIKNKTNNEIIVTGIIKVEFRDVDNRVWYDKKNFEEKISANKENMVSTHYKPSGSYAGCYQTLEFWIDKIVEQNPSSNSSYGTSPSNEINTSYGGNDCAYRISGICTTEDIGGVEVSKKTHPNPNYKGYVSYLVFENYNNFTVTVIFEYETEGVKKTGTIVLKANETKETNDSYWQPSNLKLIARRLSN